MPKVLVVDDSLSVRKVVERALAAMSIQVVSVASGSEALERIEREEPDLVVCDVIMPDKDGYEICEFVKTHPSLRKTPVLLISGIVNSTVLERAAKVHSDDVMRKPFAADELMRKIDSLLGNGATTRSLAAPRSPEGESGPLAALPLTERAAPPAAPPTPSRPAPPPDLRTSLAQVAALPGVLLAAIVDREGFLMEVAGEAAAAEDLAWALAACVADASEELGGELRQGALQVLIVEYEAGVLLVNAVGPTALLAVVLRDPTALGKVRYSVKKALPELLRVV